MGFDGVVCSLKDHLDDRESVSLSNLVLRLDLGAELSLMFVEGSRSRSLLGLSLLVPGFLDHSL
jgi:hypothetical protein